MDLPPLDFCPFCGSHRVMPGGMKDHPSLGEGFFICCVDCHAYGPVCQSQYDAWLGWNHRVWSPRFLQADSSVRGSGG